MQIKRMSVAETKRVLHVYRCRILSSSVLFCLYSTPYNRQQVVTHVVVTSNLYWLQNNRD